MSEKKDKPTFLYGVIKQLFRGACGLFYSRVEVRGEENLPKAGVPTILIFNHSNSLADSVVLLGNAKRMIRFCAKNTLWDLPLFGQLIKSSGALPLFRARENGSSARSQNDVTFRAVYSALKDQGTCVGLAAEGRSELVPFVATFKKGPAFIALGTLDKMADDPNQQQPIHIVPVGLSYTNREKFRSSVCLRYGEPLIVDQSWIDGSRFESRDEAVKQVTHEMQHRMHKVTFNSPDWETSSMAMTALKLLCPLGGTMSLGSYFDLLNGWIQVLQVGHMNVPVDAQFSDKLPPHLEQFATVHATDNDVQTSISDLREFLAMYQRVLEQHGLSDERVRRIALEGPLSTFRIVKRMMFRVGSILPLSCIVLPAFIVWSPFLYLAKRKERKLLSEGMFWADSVTEWKMVMVFIGFVLYMLLFNVWFPMIFVYSWISLRCYEEIMAHTRSLCSLYNMLFISENRMEILAASRATTKSRMEKLVHLLPQDARDVLDSLAEQTKRAETSTKVFEPIWKKWNPRRRTPNSYNETLRVRLSNHMGYTG